MLQNYEYRPGFQQDDNETDVNADMSRPVVVNTASMVWSASPAAGVERKRLELIGQPHPQLTTMVRFAPGSEFTEHSHDGGEEFLVLSGVFSDSFGDFGAGSYVRNPPGTRHAPFTRVGCTILVKLRQFQVDDKRQCAISTQPDNAVAWHAVSAGADYQLLHHYRDEHVLLFRMRANATLPEVKFASGAEFYILDGSVQIAGAVFTAGDWLRFPPGSSLEISALSTTSFYLKEGPGSRYV